MGFLKKIKATGVEPAQIGEAGLKAHNLPIIAGHGIETRLCEGGTVVSAARIGEQSLGGFFAKISATGPDGSEFTDENYWVKPVELENKTDVLDPIVFRDDPPVSTERPTHYVATNVAEVINHSHTLRVGDIVFVTVQAEPQGYPVYLIDRLPDSNLRGKAIGTATGVGWYLANSIGGTTEADGTEDLEEVHLGNLHATDLLVCNLEEVGTTADEHLYADRLPAYFVGIVIGTVPEGHIYAGRRIVIAAAFLTQFPFGGRPAILIDAPTPAQEQADEQYWFKFATLTGGTEAANPVFSIDPEDVTAKLATNLAEATQHSHGLIAGLVVWVNQTKNEAGEITYVFDRQLNPYIRGKLTGNATYPGWYPGILLSGNSTATGEAAGLAEADIGTTAESVIVAHLLEIDPRNATFNEPQYKTDAGTIYFTGIVIGRVPSGTHVGKRIIIAHHFWGASADITGVGVNSEGAVDADAEGWDLKESFNLRVWMMSRAGYHHDGDQILAGYARQLTFRNGLLVKASSETRFEIDTPVACPTLVDGGTSP